MILFSRKTRLVGAALLAASMALGGTAWGQGPDLCSDTYDTFCSMRDGRTVTLNDGESFSTAKDLEIISGTVILNNSTINTNGGLQNGDGYGFTIDSDRSNSPTATVSVNPGKTATLNADGFFSIHGTGVLRLGEGATAKINLYTSGSTTNNGIFILGNTTGLGSKYTSEFGNFTLSGDPVDFDGDPELIGGLFQLDAGSHATITGRAIFGGVGYGGEDWDQWVAGGGSDVGLHLAKDSHLQINGKAWFLSNSLLTVDQTSGDAAISATDTITIQEDAWVRIKNGSVNDVLMEAIGGFIIEHALMNPVYTFRISNNQMLIDSMASNTVMGSFGQNGNYAGAGRLIDNIFDNTTGISAELKNRLATNLQEIYFADGKLAETALKQLIGEEALAANTAVQNSLSQGNQALGQRFQALRGNSSPSAGAGDTENRLWVGGFGQWSQQDDEDNVYGYDYNSVGVMLGYDREIAALPGLTVGFNGSWNNSTVENNSGLAESDIDSFGLGLYGLYEFSGGFFIEGDLGYGHAKNDSEITLALGGKKSGDFDIDSFQAGLNLGYDYRFEGGAILTPSVGLRYTHIKQDGWRERIVSDPQNMAIANWFDDSTQNVLEIPISLKLAKTFDQGGGYAITPELRVGAVFTATEPDSSLRMGFVGSGDSIAINGIDPGRARFTAGGGFKAQLNDTVDLFAGYDLETRSGYMGHSGSLGLGFSF